MQINEDVHNMRDHILTLRSLGVACAAIVQRLPECGTTERCGIQCPEAGLTMGQIRKSMQALFMSAMMALDAVFQADPERWDILWFGFANGHIFDTLIAQHGHILFPTQDRLIKRWAEVDDDIRTYLETTFSTDEQQVLDAEGAWHNGRRLPEIMQLTEHLMKQIHEQAGRLVETILTGDLHGDCRLGESAERSMAASA